MRVLIFGDSITQGFWDIEGGWATRLRKYYDERQLKDIFNSSEPTIFNLGISGDVTAGLIKRLGHETEARKWRWPTESFSFVFAIGINDSVMDDGTERSNPENYREELTALLLEAKKFSNRILFLGLTPCEEQTVNDRLWKSKKYSNQRILEFDKTLEKFCSGQKIPYIPIYQIMKKKMDEGERLFDDGLHPNDKGHELIFQLVRPEVDKLLANK